MSWIYIQKTRQNQSIKREGERMTNIDKDLQCIKEFYEKYNIFPLVKIAGDNNEGLDPKRPIKGVSWKDKRNHITSVDAFGEAYKNHKAWSLVCGESSNIMVLDIDIDKSLPYSERKSFALDEKLDPLLQEADLTEEEIQQVKSTLTIKSPNGGYHLYFKYRPGLKNRSSFKGTCDFKTEGGLTTAPYTIIPDDGGKLKRYQPFNDKPIQEMSDKLFDFLYTLIGETSKRGPGRPKDTFANDLINLKGMKDGDGRNTALNETLYKWSMRHNLTDLTLIKILAKSINEEVFGEPEEGWEATAESVWKAMQEGPSLPIWERGNCYYKATNKGGNMAISNFVIKPVKYIKCRDYPDENVFTARLHTQDGEVIKRTFKPKDLDNKNKFLDIINSLNTRFIGKVEDLQYIKTLINDQVTEVIEGFKMGGMHKIDDAWYFISEGGALGPDGNIEDDIIQIPGEGIKSNILTHDPITKEELKEISPLLFNFNGPAITSGIMGYMGSLFLKERLIKDYKTKFNHLLIIGEAGAGKTETVENIIIPILGITSSIGSASGVTKFVMDKMAGSTNIFPYIIDEYKPSQLKQTTKNEISNMCRSIYDGLTSARGNEKQQLNEILLSSPLILIGEASTDETAVIERSLLLTFSKMESSRYTEGFKRLKDTNLLPKLGRGLLDNALQISNEELTAIVTDIQVLLKRSDIKTHRILTTLEVTMIGIYMLERAYERLELDFEKETGVKKEDVFNILHKNIKEENLGGTDKTKTMVEKTLDYMSQALGKLSTYECNRDNVLALGYINKSDVGIRIDNIWPETTKYMKDHGINVNELLNRDDFKKQLEKTPYFMERGKNINHFITDTKTSSRFTILDMAVMELHGINVDGFKRYIENAEKFKQPPTSNISRVK